MKGRKTLPTEVKKLNGTLRKSRTNTNELKPTLVIDYPSAPLILNDYAVSVWNKTIPELRTLGVLSNIDMELITAYCIEMGRYNEAQDLIKKNGSPITKAPSGYAMIHPWYTISRQSLKSAVEIGSMFGITPSARARVQTNNNKPSKLDSLLNGTGS